MEVKKKVQLMQYNDGFYDHASCPERKLIVYGMGLAAEKVYPYLHDISYICDRKAEAGQDFHGIKVIRPESLEKLDEKFIILICVKKEVYRMQIKDMLYRMDIDALVFDFYNNISFNVFHERKRLLTRETSLKKVRFVCSDGGWILRKFAIRMQEELKKKGIQADIGKSVDVTAAINHHIAFHEYEPIADYNDTLMVTHIISANELGLLKHQLQVAKLGICMSRATMEQLVMMGIPREKLCYINPAQDGVIKPKKYVLGITHRVHEDHRKRSAALLDICDGISPDYFEFIIMGDGWEEIIKEVRKKGFIVTYYPEFDYDAYIKIIPSLDYYLFWGFDEGSMGYLDALAAGVGTIVTPQGFHLDARNGITYPCRTIPDFIDALHDLEVKRSRITNSVSDWTWESYTEKHIEVWKYLLGEEDVYRNQHRYEDGICSVMRLEN